MQHGNMPPLDTRGFDALTSSSQKIWGLTAIAAALGVSVDKARRLARRPGVPIYKNEAGYVAFRAELNTWLRRKA